MSQSIQGLIPNTNYYFQLVAWNTQGTNAALASFNSGILHLVSSTNDDGTAGTLRTILANAAPGAAVGFAATLSGATLFLTQGQIQLSNNVTIDASALPGGIQINGNHASSLFYVETNVTVVMNSLTLNNGIAQGAQGNDISSVSNGGSGAEAPSSTRAH